MSNGFTVIYHEVLDSLAARLLSGRAYGLLIDFIRAWSFNQNRQYGRQSTIRFSWFSSQYPITRRAFNRARSELIEKGFIEQINRRSGLYRWSENWRMYQPTPIEMEKLNRYKCEKDESYQYLMLIKSEDVMSQNDSSKNGGRCIEMAHQNEDVMSQNDSSHSDGLKRYIAAMGQNDTAGSDGSKAHTQVVENDTSQRWVKSAHQIHPPIPPLVNTTLQGKTINDVDQDQDQQDQNDPIEARSKREVEQDFHNRFWPAYPRRVAKQAALKAWKKINPSTGLVDQMLAALDQQKRSADWQKDGGKFIPHPATWLNQGRWEDELTPDIPQAPAESGGESDPGYINKTFDELTSEELAQVLGTRPYEHWEYLMDMGAARTREEADGIVAADRQEEREMIDSGQARDIEDAQAQLVQWRTERAEQMIADGHAEDMMHARRLIAQETIERTGCYPGSTDSSGDSNGESRGTPA